MATTQRRDRNGKFVPVCKHLGGCDTRAQYGIDGYGFFGLYSALRSVYCKRHGDAAVKRMNRGHGYMRGTYRLVKVSERGW